MLKGISIGLILFIVGIVVISCIPFIHLPKRKRYIACEMKKIVEKIDCNVRGNRKYMSEECLVKFEDSTTGHAYNKFIGDSIQVCKDVYTK